MAFGVIGLTPLEFYRMSLKQFRATQRGFFEKQRGELRQRWETARFISFNSLIPHAKKGRLKSPKDLIIFEWEKAASVKVYDWDKINYEVRKSGKYIDKHGNFHN